VRTALQDVAADPAHQVPALRTAVLDHFAAGLETLLRRVGLSGDGRLAQAIHGITP
jgi:hypothetical protein